MSDVIDRFPEGAHDARPAVWTDKAGVTHKAVGANVTGAIAYTLLLWTACGQKDIPANAAWLQRPEDALTCEACRSTTPPAGPADTGETTDAG